MTYRTVETLFAVLLAAARVALAELHNPSELNVAAFIEPRLEPLIELEDNDSVVPSADSIYEDYFEETKKTTTSDETTPNVTSPAPPERYMFYRDLNAARARLANSSLPGGGGGGGGGSRRVFGGRALAADAWGAACVVLDGGGAAHCSGAVLAARWALTAAHCAGAAAAAVRYAGAGGAAAAGVAARLRHPQYAVRLAAAPGAALDVLLLQHDVALLRTRADMRLLRAPRVPPLQALRRRAPRDLLGTDLEVLGFGRDELGPGSAGRAGYGAGPRLRGVRLRGVACERAEWRGCVCAEARGAGVCAGDSGGPALQAGLLVALASLGPAACARPAAPRRAASSVLTPLQPYAAMIDATLAGTPGGFAPAPDDPMSVRSAASRSRRPAALLPILLLTALADTYCRGATWSPHAPAIKR